tara:strand:- start:654 stop:959 length:306 start_codon:yes stop_codon:yes gene_type:complete
MSGFNLPEGDNSFLDREERDDVEMCSACDKLTHIDDTWEGPDSLIYCDKCIHIKFGCTQCGLYPGSRAILSHSSDHCHSCDQEEERRYEAQQEFEAQHEGE